MVWQSTAETRSICMRSTELCEKIDEAEQLVVAADLPYMLRLLDGVARASLSGREEHVDEADRNELVSHQRVSRQ
eukprot:SAG31_NODE_18318_length_640_cov_1.521257_1_plen_75_part_00